MHCPTVTESHVTVVSMPVSFIDSCTRQYGVPRIRICTKVCTELSCLKLNMIHGLTWSKMAIGMARVTQQLGASTIPAMWPSQGQHDSIR